LEKHKTEGKGCAVGSQLLAKQIQPVLHVMETRIRITRGAAELLWELLVPRHAAGWLAKPLSNFQKILCKVGCHLIHKTVVLSKLPGQCLVSGV
jgi:hypothetical protein